MSAFYKRSLDGRQVTSMEIKTNAAVVAGDLLAITSGLVGPVTAADTGIIGIAAGPAASGAMCPVILLNEMSVVRVPIVGTTKTTLAEADLFGTKFDWDATNKKLNLDDVTGGFLQVVAYDNTAKTADTIVCRTALWNA